MFIWTAGGDFLKSNKRFGIFIWTPEVAQSKLYYYFWSSSPCAHVLTSTSDGRTAKLIMGQENTGWTRFFGCIWIVNTVVEQGVLGNFIRPSKCTELEI